MKSKNSSNKILALIKSQGFNKIELDTVLETKYILQRSGENFRKYLFSLGATEKEIKNRKPNEAVVKYNNILMDCSLNSSTMRSIAMMGIIEERYSKISATIVKEILKKKWVSKDSLYHYSLHEELDVEHAQGFYNIIKDEWKDIDSKEEIKKGLSLGNSMILNLYNDTLYKKITKTYGKKSFRKK